MDDLFPSACVDQESVLLPFKYTSKASALCQAKEFTQNLWCYCSTLPKDTDTVWLPQVPFWYIFSQMLDTDISTPLFFPTESLDSKAQDGE